MLQAYKTPLSDKMRFFRGPFSVNYIIKSRLAKPGAQILTDKYWEKHYPAFDGVGRGESNT